MSESAVKYKHPLLSCLLFIKKEFVKFNEDNTNEFIDYDNVDKDDDYVVDND